MTVGVGETVRAAEPEGALALPVLRRVLAAVIVAAWVAWAVPSWMSSLHEVRAHEFVADVEAGRVTGYQVVEDVHSDPITVGGQWSVDVPAADSQGRPVEGPPRQLVYTIDGATRTRWVPQAVFMVGDRDAFTALLDSGARPFTSETYPPTRDWSTYPALLGAGLALVALVLLPPTRGTRPFWLLTATVGMGLGFLAYAVSELWWRRSTPVLRADGADELGVGDGPGRLHWWHGLLTMLVGGLAAAVLRGAIT